MESGYYPPGAEFDSRAPWNEHEPQEVDLEVEVTLTISKKVTIHTQDYETDEDGSIIEYGDIKEDVRNQVETPKGWEVIDMEVDY